MNFKDLIVTIRKKLPPYVRTIMKNDIYSCTENLVNEYIRLLEVVDEDNYNSILTTKAEVIKNIVFQRNIILSAINSFHKGDIVECYEVIFKEYFYEDLDIFKVIAYKEIPAHKPLFRLRVNKTNKPYNYEEMFHIPYDKVHLVNNQRFSLSGYPCLYLGTSSYGCWEELNRPDIERCNFSVFGNESILKMVDLSPPQEVKSISDLLRFPLIISCSIKMSDEFSPFKPEYIIPQSVLQCVIKLNNKKITDIHLDGILYLSTKISEKLFFKEENNMYNFVLPTISRTNSKYCTNLAELFIISDAVTYQELWLKFPQLVAAFDEDIDFTTENYDLSVFRKIEKFVIGKTVQKTKIIY